MKIYEDEILSGVSKRRVEILKSNEILMEEIEIQKNKMHASLNILYEAKKEHRVKINQLLEESNNELNSYLPKFEVDTSDLDQIFEQSLLLELGRDNVQHI